MAHTPDAQIVISVSRDIVAHVSRKELSAFRATSEQYFKNPDRLPMKQKSVDRIVGFGVGDAMLLAAPYVLMFVNEVVKYLSEEATKYLAGKSGSAISEFVKKQFKKFRPQDSGEVLPPLTHSQIQEIYKRIYERAAAIGLASAQARLLADAIVGSLVVESL